MSETMSVWQLEAWSLEALQQVRRPIPIPAENEVLVRVGAVSLNYRDTLVARGQLLLDLPSLPFVPVSDMAGEIVAMGNEVTRFQVGDHVAGNYWTQWIDGEPPLEMRRHGLSLGGPLPGMLAEYVVLHEEVAVKVPESLTLIEASTLPIAALTAWFALVETGQLQAGQTVLIQGTGGVAMFGLQFAQAFGAHAIVISRSASKLARVKELGATEGIDTSVCSDWSEQVMTLTNGRGVDHVLELIGGENLRKSTAALASGGRIAQIGFLENDMVTFSVVPLMLRLAIIQGIAVGHRRAFEEMNQAIDIYQIKPVIDQVYKFAEARLAFAHLERGPLGKVVIAVG